jgi:hypothetical protein
MRVSLCLEKDGLTHQSCFCTFIYSSPMPGTMSSVVITDLEVLANVIRDNF